eukprot:g552.t1
MGSCLGSMGGRCAAKKRRKKEQRRKMRQSGYTDMFSTPPNRSVNSYDNDDNEEYDYSSSSSASSMSSSASSASSSASRLSKLHASRSWKKKKKNRNKKKRGRDKVSSYEEVWRKYFSDTLVDSVSALLYPPRYPLRRSRNRMTLVLDMDETLLHATTSVKSLVVTQEGSIRPDIVLDVPVPNTGKWHSFYVFLRPHVRTFLRILSQWYEIVIFTASEKRYAEPLVQMIDTEGVVSRSYYRESCVKKGSMYIKNLRMVRSDLSRVIIIDNSPQAYSLNPENAIPCTSWFGDRNDDELLQLIPLLSCLQGLEDVRSVLSLRILEAF